MLTSLTKGRLTKEKLAGLFSLVLYSPIDFKVKMQRPWGLSALVTAFRVHVTVVKGRH